MAIEYTPPGVSITEKAQQSISTLIGTPDDVCLIGYGNPYEYSSLSRKQLIGLKSVNLGIPSTATVEDNPITKVTAVNALTANNVGMNTVKIGRAHV